MTLSVLIGGLNKAPASLSTPSRIKSVELKEISGSFRHFLAKIIAAFKEANLVLSFSELSVLMYLLNEVFGDGKSIDSFFVTHISNVSADDPGVGFDGPFSFREEITKLVFFGVLLSS